MQVVIVIIIVVAYILYLINKDNKKHVKQVVTSRGGMLEKYSVLINYFKECGGHIEKITRDSVSLKTSSTIWYLDVVGDNLEIRINAIVPVVGALKHKWTYPHNFSQEKMIADIENYLSWYLEQLSSKLQQDPRENLNF